MEKKNTKKETEYLNNYCNYCGKKLKNNAKKCFNCEEKVLVKRINIEKKQQELGIFQKREKIYLFALVGLFSLCFVLPYINLLIEQNVIASLYPLVSIALLILMIYIKFALKRSLINSIFVVSLSFFTLFYYLIVFAI